MRISVVMPAFDEATVIAGSLAALAPLRRGGHEVIVVDGGSRDGTVQLARPLCDRLLESARGRAVQMNAGAAAASGDVLLFLHADTALPDHAVERIRQSVRDHAWGRFDVRIEGTHRCSSPHVSAFLRERNGGEIQLDADDID